tara:strand:+ start:627 stop:1088 length:462 start_codon:yes stop_codon:yes gene_type:complete
MAWKDNHKHCAALVSAELILYMKTLREIVVFNCSAEDLWEILSDVARCDWVPTIDKIALDGDCRIFEMEGMGQITEKILLSDDQTMTLEYSAIDTPSPIQHHLAIMKVSVIDNQSSSLEWKTEIDPEILADRVHQGMLISIEGLKNVLSNNAG